MKIVLDGGGLAKGRFLDGCGLLVTMRSIRFINLLKVTERKNYTTPTIEGAVSNCLCAWDNHNRTRKFECWGMNPYSNKAPI